MIRIRTLPNSLIQGFSRKFSIFARHFYTTPLKYGEFKITPARKVPAHIPRPGYVGNPDYPHHNLVLDPIRIHSEKTLQKMRAASKLAAKAVSNAIKAVKVGITTDHLDEIVHNTIVEGGAYPSPIDYYGFPKSVCTSVNEVVVHGIPDLRPLKDGDYVNVDVTCFLDGVHGDSSAMALVGNVHPDIVKLVFLLENSRKRNKNIDKRY